MTPITPLPQQQGGGEYLPTRRARVESIDLFDVKKEELDLIEAGLSNTPTTLAFATFSASIAIACLIAMVTTEKYRWPMMESVFSGVGFTGLVLSAFLAILWYRGRSSQKKLISGIRMRMKNGNGHLSNRE